MSDPPDPHVCENCGGVLTHIFKIERDLAAAHARVAELEAERDRLDLGVEIAFGIIANTGGGDWTTQTQEWQDAAASWRDDFYGPHCARAALAGEEKP